MKERPTSLVSCNATTNSGTTCSRSAHKSGFCGQHDKDAKISMYKKELARMHQRVRRYLEICNNLHSKIMDIQRLDFYKSELIKIGGSNRAFRSIIDSPLYRAQVEALFDMSADEAQNEYDRLLEKRNALVYPYSLDGLNGQRMTRTRTVRY
ncbi:unnamed protein product [Phytophthora lilii]|uniref:Unnamed protein product n=1 Tax=Phytophthora lilii TaxID=2077276 RepID=A0A9W6X5K6_9STRA|nr:unnamed protein product [Phytophthora lilii]